MTWWNMGGLNPKFKDFTNKHPDATLLGMGWAFYWRFALLALIVEAVVFAAVFVAGATFGFGHHRMSDEWGRSNMMYGPGQAGPAGKLNINVVCQGALAYMTFADASSSEAFVADCVLGNHPEVIEQYKASHGFGDGAQI